MKDDIYDNPKRVLWAEIDQSAWHSIPVDRPYSGYIAVKVINHYEDEVLKAGK